MTDEIKALKAELDKLVAKMKPNHIKLAKALADGKSQAEAYKISGGKGKDAKALGCQLILTNPNIEKYAELVQKIAHETSLPKQIATLEQKRDMLWRIANHCSAIAATPMDEDESIADDADLVIRDPRSAIAAVAELNKMDGHLAAIKNDTKVTQTVEFNLSLGGKKA